MISEQMTGGFTVARSPFPLGHTHSLVWFSTDTNLFFLIEQRLYEDKTGSSGSARCRALECEQHVHCASGQMCWNEN